MNSFVLVYLIVAFLASSFTEAINKRFIFRLDDIQDFYYSSAQQQILTWLMDNGYGVTAGIIGDYWNAQDAGLYSVLQRCVSMSKDKCALFNHGSDAQYVFADASSVAEAQDQIKACDDKIKTHFPGYQVELFVPHQNSWGDYLLQALRNLGYSAVSASTLSYSNLPQSLTTNPIQLSQQTETGEYNPDGSWSAWPIDTAVADCEAAMSRGDAVCVIMMHPFEFGDGVYTFTMLQQLINRLTALGYTSTNFHTIIQEVKGGVTPTGVSTPAPSFRPTTKPNAVTVAPTIANTRAPTVFQSSAPSYAPGSVSTPWGQCGGQNYIGPTLCPDGYVCTFGSIWYSQCKPCNGNCQPASSAAPTVATTAAPSVAPTKAPVVTGSPTAVPSTSSSIRPSVSPTLSTGTPTRFPTIATTTAPTQVQSINPTTSPTAIPTRNPTTVISTSAPTTAITNPPTVLRTTAPTASTTGRPSSNPNSVATQWGQCGGFSYTGPTNCPAGFTCVYGGFWYSQCNPCSGSCSTPTPTASSTPAPTNPPGTVSAAWGQCGGIGYTGPSNCPNGFSCIYGSAWYSQCKPATTNSARASLAYQISIPVAEVQGTRFSEASEAALMIAIRIIQEQTGHHVDSLEVKTNKVQSNSLLASSIATNQLRFSSESFDMHTGTVVSNTFALTLSMNVYMEDTYSAKTVYADSTTALTTAAKSGMLQTLFRNFAMQFNAVESSNGAIDSVSFSKYSYNAPSSSSNSSAPATNILMIVLPIGICLLLFVSLSYFIIRYYRQQMERDRLSKQSDAFLITEKYVSADYTIASSERQSMDFVEDNFLHLHGIDCDVNVPKEEEAPIEVVAFMETDIPTVPTVEYANV